MQILLDPETHQLSVEITREERQTARKDAWLRHARTFPKATLREIDQHLFVETRR